MKSIAAICIEQGGGGGHIMVLWYNGDRFKALFMYIIGQKKMFQVIILELF